MTLSGLYTTFLTLGLVAGLLTQPGGIERFTWVYDHWVPLISACLAWAFITACWVYTWSFFSGELLALGGNSGNFIYDVSPSRVRTNTSSDADRVLVVHRATPQPHLPWLPQL